MRRTLRADCADGRRADRQPAAVRLLLEKGADPNVRTKRNETALADAATAGNEETVKLLLDRGAEVNVQDIRGYSPLAVRRRIGHHAGWHREDAARQRRRPECQRVTARPRACSPPSAATPKSPACWVYRTEERKLLGVAAGSRRQRTRTLDSPKR